MTLGGAAGRLGRVLGWLPGREAVGASFPTGSLLDEAYASRARFARIATAAAAAITRMPLMKRVMRPTLAHGATGRPPPAGWRRARQAGVHPPPDSARRKRPRRPRARPWSLREGRRRAGSGARTDPTRSRAVATGAGRVRGSSVPC